MFEQQEVNEEHDPVEWGWTLPMWRRCLELWEDNEIIVIFGGNRSSKSTFAARLSVWLALNIPAAEIRCWHTASDRSIEDQQKFIYEALPQQYKDLTQTQSKDYALGYSQKEGFSKDIAIFPKHPGYKTGSYIKFNNYNQWHKDPQKIEGMSCHFIWADEEIPQKLFATFPSRLNKFEGKLLLTFTTLQGWTSLVSDLLYKAKVDTKRYSPIAEREIPYEMTSTKWDSCKIVHFWSQDNPFESYENLYKRYSGQSTAHQIARLHGIPEKAMVAKFPKFSLESNVIEHKYIPFVRSPQENPVTRYHIIDPAGGRNWCMIWLAIDRYNNWWVYREWPDISYGNWAEPWVNAAQMPIGKRGRAQELSFGGAMSYESYSNLIREKEGTEIMFGRLIDPRMGKEQRPSLNSTTSFIQGLSMFNLFYSPAKVHRDSTNSEIEPGIQAINTLLEYNTDEPVGENNRPKLKVSDQCQNFIYCMQEYTNCSREEATKDFVDVLRYGVVTPCIFAGEGRLAVTKGVYSY